MIKRYDDLNRLSGTNWTPSAAPAISGSCAVNANGRIGWFEGPALRQWGREK